MIRFKTLVMVLVIGTLLVSCSHDDKPGSFCPLIDDQGPQVVSICQVPPHRPLNP